jgi:acyl-coenzyme A thioesterase PaaI-like protein
MTEKDKRLSGYTEWQGGGAFEEHNGPFFYKEKPEGCDCAFIVKEKHTSEGGAVHGGMLSIFANFASFMAARSSFSGGGATTISLNTDFAEAGNLGDLIESRCEIMHETKGMVFTRGALVVGEKVLLSFSCVIKKLRKR